MKLIWRYTLQFWSCANSTNRAPIKTFKNKVVPSIVDAPFYIKNTNLHRDLNIVINKKLRDLPKHEPRDASQSCEQTLLDSSIESVFGLVKVRLV